ncbi:hypothetical protein [Streptomyces griseofuscus]
MPEPRQVVNAAGQGGRHAHAYNALVRRGGRTGSAAHRDADPEADPAD